MQRKLIVGIIMAGLVISLLVAALFGAGARDTSTVGSAEGAVGVIRISGAIMDGASSSGIFGAASGSRTIMEQLRRAARDPSIKVVVLRLNTPGGTAAASQEIALEVDRLRQGGKKVVASMGDTAASGGYWIASRCDKIVASPGTITGSIGVIVQTQDLQGLYQKIGVDNNVFKSGAHKDMGSSSREITPAEQQIFQTMVDQLYEQFIATVSSGRGMDPGRVKELADGRIFTGQQALELGLVDKLGNYYDAIDLATDLAGLKGEPVVLDLAPKIPWWENLTSFRLDLPAFYSPAWLIYADHEQI